MTRKECGNDKKEAGMTRKECGNDKKEAGIHKYEKILRLYPLQ